MIRPKADYPYLQSLFEFAAELGWGKVGEILKETASIQIEHSKPIAFRCDRFEFAMTKLGHETVFPVDNRNLQRIQMRPNRRVGWC